MGGIAALMSKIVSKWLIKPFFVIIAKLTIVLESLMLFFDEKASKVIIVVAEKITVQLVSGNPDVQAAALQSSQVMAAALRPHQMVAYGLIGAAIVIPIAAALLPLAASALLRPRARVFVSFSHAREHQAKAMQRDLDYAGVETFRMPFRANTNHQEVVDVPIAGIRRCHLFVCLPGGEASFVDHEVYAATAVDKPIAFVVSEYAGRLPNSADKRYPVFRLETLVASAFAPLVLFLRHVAGDFRSTVMVVHDAYLHPAVRLSTVWLASSFALTLAAVFAGCLISVWSVRTELLARLPEFASAVDTAFAVSVGLLGLLAGFALVVTGWGGLVIARLVAQFRARRRMQRVTTAAAFRRDDWLGAIPGLAPGSPLFEAFFETAPLAHHEGMAAARTRKSRVGI